MKNRRLYLVSGLLLAGLVLSACGLIPMNLSERATNLLADTAASTPVMPLDSPPSTSAMDPGLIQAYEGTLAEIYGRVNDSVVNIRVTKPVSAADLAQNSQLPFDHPTIPGLPNEPQYQYGLGSGFIWNDSGIIVTNNHVIDGADTIEVNFTDGTSVPAEVIGADPDTDLAVLKVSADSRLLLPVQVADSDQVNVGDLAIAIGNPFGLKGTMTTGIVSALGRSIPASETTGTGPNFSIPEVIQTDAAINPGNSGGVLLNDQGQVIGVTTAIESPVGANSGVGFAVPSALVKRVVPALIETGHYDHPYLGITGTTLTRELSDAMSLDSNQRGALVGSVVTGGPADKAGLKGSTSQVAVAGAEIPVGGDVVVAINGTTIESMDDLISYLMNRTEVGETVTLKILRDGNESSVDVVLEARPAVSQEATPVVSAQGQATSPVYLGIRGAPLTSEINTAMDLASDQTGILVVEVEAGSPAEQAGLRGGSTPALVDGQALLVGGDVITAIDGKSIGTVDELRARLAQSDPGDEVALTVLRDGEEIEISAVLGSSLVIQP